MVAPIPGLHLISAYSVCRNASSNPRPSSDLLVLTVCKYGEESPGRFFLSFDIIVTRTVWGREGLASGTRLYTKLQPFVYSLVPRPEEEGEEKGPGFSRLYLGFELAPMAETRPFLLSLQPGPGNV